MKQHNCSYSRSMNQEYPRKCIECGVPEVTVEMRSKSASYETDIQKLQRDVGFWQDQVGREQEKVQKLEAKLTTLTSVLRMAEEALDNYGQHEKDCLCAQYQAGRPTADGGYETLFGFGKDERWYQKGEWPNCSCGYTDVITKIREVLK